MRARSLLLLLLSLSFFCSQPASAAGVPDPGHSGVDACLGVCPDGDITFRVKVRDILGLPVANSLVEVNFCACPSVALCVTGCQQARFTDAGGDVDIQIRAGGTCPGGVLIRADGVILASRGVASPDQNGDLFVDAADVAEALPKIGLADPTADLDCDGVVSPADLTIIGSHQEHSCLPVPTLEKSWGRMKAIYR